MMPFFSKHYGGKRLMARRLPPFVIPKAAKLCCLLPLLLCLLASCASKSSLTQRDYRALAKAGIALGVDIDYDDDHPLFLEAAKWMGTPYRNGGNSKRGIDCSGLTHHIYKKAYHKKIPRTTREQYESCRTTVRRPSQLQQGDLVFFHPAGKRKTCNHVGIFLKDGKFIHASSSRGVVVDRLDSKHWAQLWLSGGRKE